MKDPKIKGWNIEAIARTQKAKWPEFLQATKDTGPLTIAHEALTPRDDDFQAHHLVMAYAYVLGLAAWKKNRIALLDWGGGIGHYCILSRRLLPDLKIEYCCKDVPILCHAGREVLPEAKFVEREDEVLSHLYDLVLASGSLQCSEDWQQVANVLVSVANPFIYVTRLPTVSRSKSFVVRQRAYAYNYDSEYLSWFLNRDEFINAFVSNECELVREFVFHEHPAVQNAPEQARIRGFLFRSRRAESERSTGII